MRTRLPGNEDLLEAFIVANIGFLGVDILLAHASNSFARPVEWLPIAFSSAAAAFLLPGLLSRSLRTRVRGASLAIGGASILVGIAGMIFHLESAFFASRTLHALVYSAPFIAPLSYIGVGLLLLLSRYERAGSSEWRLWVVLLALGGYAGNLGLSLLDHAQNGFFSPFEWLSVLAAAFAVAFLSLVPFRMSDEPYRRVCLCVLAAAALIGVVGAGFHLHADLLRSATHVTDRVLYGAPIFAPLLFTNLSLLGWIGLKHGDD